MTHRITATLSASGAAASARDVPVSTDFWRPVVQIFLSRADHFRIDCRNDEQGALAAAAVLGAAERWNMSGAMTAFEGTLTPVVRRTIITCGLDSDGTPRWFSLFLYRGREQLFSSQHYGTLLTASGVDNEDLAILRSLLPASASIVLDQDG